MDFSFFEYSKAVYDTNCIIYYRLNFSRKFKKKEINLTPDEFYIVGRITSQFLDKNYTIHTLKIAFDEILKKGIATIVEQFLVRKYRDLRERHGLRRIASRYFEEKVSRSIEELKEKEWFFIVECSPLRCFLEQIKNLYKGLPDSPEKQRLIQKNKVPYPNDVDISLIIYSKAIGSPLLTNDRDIYDFKPELEMNNCCTKIIPLPDLAQNNLSYAN